jgi:hypothetical protein
VGEHSGDNLCEETMKSSAPVLTLVVVAALAAVLFVANSLSAPAAQTVAAPAPAASSAPAEPAVPPPPPPPPPPTPPPAVVVEKVFAGRSSGNEVTVAVAVKDGRAVAYVCDGKKIEAWLEGTVEGTTMSLTGPGGALVTGTVDDAASFGIVGAGGKKWPYSAKAVVAPEGIYRGRADVRGVTNRIGWIVLDGTQTGVIERGGTRSPAPQLDPSNPGGLTVDGAPVTVTAVTGGEEVVVS